MTKKRKDRLEERLLHAETLRKRTEKVAQTAAELADEQTTVSEKLRDQRRKNHFAELFQFGIPKRKGA